MPTRNINLTEHFDRFIEAGVTSGRFGSASEVVREGLRLLEQREQQDQDRLEWLRAAVQEATDSLDRGEGIGFESMNELDDFIRKTGAEGSATSSTGRERA